MKLDVTIKTERNYGIDLLRLVSMFYVLVLHSLGKGGVLDAAAEGSVQYQFSWFMEMWAYCAVNIFAIISGYVGYSDTPKKYNYSNYLLTWLQVVFYGVAVTLLFYLINPEWVTRKELLRMFFPVTRRHYWYFNAYTGLFFVIPLLNGALRQCNREYLRKAFIGFILLFSVYDIATGWFEFARGYSFAWLVILYFLGASMKKCDIGKHMHPAAAVAGILVCCTLSWLWKMHGVPIKILGKIEMNNHQLVNYVAPTHLCAAILHVILFSKLKFGGIWKKLISFAAPGAFAVYLLNNQRHVWKYVMKERFQYLAYEPVHVIFLHVMLFCLVFLTVAVLADFVRRKLFSALRIKKAANYITEGLSKALGWCGDKLLT